MSKVIARDERAQDAPWALCKLPSFPPIAARLLQALSKEDVELRELTRLISSDAAFSAEILRLANSALYGLEGQINSLTHAVLLLGLSRVKSLAMTVAIMKDYLKGVLKSETLRRCWTHSLACAFLAEELAPACGLDKDYAYTVGLLHDIGRLSILVAYPAEYTNLLKVAEENSFNVLECERQLFDIDHCQAGQWLAAQWNLPPEFGEVLSRHHQPAAGPQFGAAGLIHVACNLSDALGFNVLDTRELPDFGQIASELPKAARDRVSLNSEELKARIGGRIVALLRGPLN
ncbi:MAG: HDOD domain-containing protein [Acidobacteriales bacterium]|nr:HDOD domain-containing protein [Terriglobales bacterium]